MSTGSKIAWSDFWQAGGAGPESGCLPKALRQIDAVQRRVWAEVAASLRPGARVLDLATGDGAVLGKIRASRTDLKLIGVDSAQALPRAPKTITLRAGVAMEKLPFPDAGFDLVSSQFGFEYGDRAAVSREVARMLRAGGRYVFIVHHAAGPILGHNQARRAGLGWAVVESKLLRQAHALVAARRISRLPTPASFGEAPAMARRLFPGQTVAEEFVTAIHQTLELGRFHPPDAQRETLLMLEQRGRNEMARIDALSAAACTAADIEAIEKLLRGAGLFTQTGSELYEPDNPLPFAWLLRGGT
jgi:SAM-dependent methyltransferase